MVAVVELCTDGLAPIQRDVFSAYARAFAKRGLFLKPVPAPGARPCLFSNGASLVDKQRHCYWNYGDTDVDEEGAGDAAWLWHHGPTTGLLDGDHPRVILLPRNDLFEIRGIHNVPEGWAAYRAQIDTTWSDKLDEVYFRGHFTGAQTSENQRATACRNIEAAGVPANVGVLAEFTPPELRSEVPCMDPDALAVMGQYKYVLSLWGNHPFNPRLYRGLEAGSLVFHQATPTIRLLEDGLLVPNEHYVELAPDLSDLLEKLDHFMSHPAEARSIAEEGHRAWMETLFVTSPYAMADVVWERFTAQPNWPAFREAFSAY